MPNFTLIREYCRFPAKKRLLVQLKKIKGCNNGMDILYLHAKFDGDPPLHGGMRKKSWEFLFCFFLFVMLWILNLIKDWLTRGLVIQRLLVQLKKSPCHHL